MRVIVDAAVVDDDDDGDAIDQLNDVGCFVMLARSDHAIQRGHDDLCAVYAPKMVAIPYLS